MGYCTGALSGVAISLIRHRFLVCMLNLVCILFTVFFNEFLYFLSYIVSPGMASKVYQIALTLPIIHVEDVFITGFVRLGYGAATLVNLAGTSFFRDYNEIQILTQSANLAAAVDHIQPEQMYELWNHSRTVFAAYRESVDDL